MYPQCCGYLRAAIMPWTPHGIPTAQHDGGGWENVLGVSLDLSECVLLAWAWPCVVVWMRMSPWGSYIYMFGSQFVFLGRVRKYGLIRESMLLGEGYEVSKANASQLPPRTLPHLVSQTWALSYSSTIMPVYCCHASHQDGHGLTLWNCNPSIKFCVISSLGHGASS